MLKKDDDIANNSHNDNFVFVYGHSGAMVVMTRENKGTSLTQVISAGKKGSVT